MFSDLQDKEMKYLEVGILKGGSIEWAHKFFKKGSIFGIDKIIDKEAKDLEKVASLSEVNQGDVNGLKTYGETFGKFDIIVDDASHIRELTELTFVYLWPYVKSGGWYIIEDWSAGYSNLPEHKQYKGMVELIARIITEKQQCNIGEIKIINERKSFAAFQKKD
ncbi:MAG TPA: hypothetical protein DDY21_00045 [Candidatus Moranbacteria bacterium]|nr:hypothetical protein [Candidatus Moranbacteria bacterium]